MCRIGSRRSGTHHLRFRSMERKICRVWVFCEHRFSRYAAMRLPRPAIKHGRGNRFTEILRPASPDEYALRAAELGVMPLPPAPERAATHPHAPQNPHPGRGETRSNRQ